MAKYKYLLGQEKDILWGLVVTTVGQQMIPPGEKYPSTDHPRRYYFTAEHGRILQEFHIVYITEGRGWFSSAHQNRMEVTAGDVLVLFPGEWHNYAPFVETGWEESWIGLTGAITENLIHEGFFSQEKPVFHIGVIEDIRRYFEEACAIASEEKKAYQQALSGLAFAILGRIYATWKQYPLLNYNAGLTDKIEQAKRFMLDNTGSILRMEKVAAHVGLGYSFFRKTFKDYTGLSPSSWFNKQKISYCKTLLTNTDLTCQEIAFRAGFDSSSSFHVFFQKKVFMTPLSYRRMTRGEAQPSNDREVL